METLHREDPASKVVSTSKAATPSRVRRSISAQFIKPSHCPDISADTRHAIGSSHSCTTVRASETPWNPVELPNFFMPPHELEQTMRALRAAALSRPQPRTLASSSTVTTPANSHDRREHHSRAPVPRKPLEPVCLPQSERDRIARIFASTSS